MLLGAALSRQAPPGPAGRGRRQRRADHRLDIEQRSKLTQLSTHKVPPRQEVLDELINEKLKVQEGKKCGLEITNSEVDSALPTWRAACG